MLSPLSSACTTMTGSVGFNWVGANGDEHWMSLAPTLHGTEVPLATWNLMVCEGHSFALLAVWWYKWKHCEEPWSCPCLVETRRHCIIGRVTHILPTYIQAARPHETSCLPGLEQLSDVCEKRGTLAFRPLVPLWSRNVGRAGSQERRLIPEPAQMWQSCNEAILHSSNCWARAAHIDVCLWRSRGSLAHLRGLVAGPVHAPMFYWWLHRCTDCQWGEMRDMVSCRWGRGTPRPNPPWFPESGWSVPEFLRDPLMGAVCHCPKVSYI